MGGVTKLAVAVPELRTGAAGRRQLLGKKLVMPATKTICILAPVHPPRDIRVFQKEARSLARAGYRVVLLAHAEAGWKESGVELVPLSYSGRWQRILLQPLFLLKVVQVRPDAVHIHNPDTLLLGYGLKLAGYKVVYDTHENFRKLIPTRTWIPVLCRKPIATIVDGLERFGAHLFDRVIVTQTAQVARFGPRAVLIENAPICHDDTVDTAFALAKGRERGMSFRVVYAGLLNAERGLYSMVDAIALLNRTVSARLWLMGTEADSLVIPKAKARPGWQYVDYLGLQSQAEAFSYMISADVGLVVFHPEADNECLNPNKLFEYQRFGIPFVASNFTGWRQYLRGVDAGLWVDPTSPSAIASALVALAKDPVKAQAMGGAGRQFILRHYNWEIEAEKLRKLYAEIFRQRAVDT